MESQSPISARILGPVLGLVALLAALLPPIAAGATVQTAMNARHVRIVTQRQTLHAQPQGPGVAKRLGSPDRDRDGLSNWTEVMRTWTNPRRADTDGDGLFDGTEVKRTLTNPRRIDSDADGASDGLEVLAKTDPLDLTSFPGPPPFSLVDPVPPPPPPPPGEESEDPPLPPPGEESEEIEPPPPPPPPDTTPPNTTLTAAPPPTTTSTSASFSFSASEAGSSFECKLDEGGFGPCSSPKSFSGLSAGDHDFEVRATDQAGNIDPSPASRDWTIESPPPPPPPGSGCVAGATQATTASQVRSAIQGNQNVCVVADVGNVNLEGLGSRVVVISTEGGSMGYVNINDTTNLTIRSARLRSTELWNANGTTIEDSVIGGTSTSRTTDNLINVNVSDDVTIKENELAWTTTSGTTTGYGIRSPGNELGYNDRLHIEGNYIHHISADAIQGLGNRAADVVIDRNRIDYVGKNPGSDEHSDGMQIINHGVNTRITNNWISHEGFYAEGQPNGSSGTLYIHGDGNGNQGALVIENNLFSDSQGRVEITGLGTGGTSMSNIVIRRNTFSGLGLGYTGFPSLRWAAASGSNNLVERNVAVDPDGGFAQNGSAGIATFTANLWGQPSLVTLDSQGNCTSANCNPSGQEAIGYRKPSGVDW